MKSPQFPPVTGVTARYQGPGSPSFTTTWYYWIQALYISGWANLSSSANTGAYAPSGLFNNGFVAVQWDPAPGAIGYMIFRNTTGTKPASGATGIFIASSETGFKDDGTFPSFTAVPRYDGVYVAKAIYDFSVDGGAETAIIPSISDIIPAGAVVFGGFVNSPTAVTSGGSATVAVGTSAGSSADSILGATGKASFTTDAVLEVLGTNSQAATQAPSFKMTAAGQIQLTVGAAALTAGVIEVNVLYVICTNP